MTKMPSSRLQILLNQIRTAPNCNRDPNAILDENVTGEWIQDMKNRIDIKISKIELDEIEFDLIHVDPSISNAFRRILIAEIPTIAIDNVFIMKNTSVIQDEVLAHRLGLVPIKADPEKFIWYKALQNGDSNHNAQNTLVFKLDVLCSWKSERFANKADSGDDCRYFNSKVYSKDIKWIPQGNQKEIFADDEIVPVNDNILIAKLRPGQEINIEMLAVLGIGQDHAKFSPVATASYRLLPTIDILQPIIGDDARKFQKCFPKGVIALDEKDGEIVARVENCRKDTVSRESLRYSEFQNKVSLGRVWDHFIFGIESVGAIPADRLFLKSIEVLKEKSIKILDSLDDHSVSFSNVS